jgi:hypothetical protein
MRLEYLYRPSLLTESERRASHQNVRAALATLEQRNSWLSQQQDVDQLYPTYQAQRSLIEKLNLREFAMRRKVSLGRVFGSRRSHFSWLPPQVLLVYVEEKLAEVFPCRIGDQEIDPLEFLECTISGKPWTSRSGGGMEGKTHKLLVARILQDSGLIETGLAFQGRDVQVSQDGEVGYVDLVFQTADDRSLLVEVKVGADELAKAIGQILWHRQLFATQNNIARDRVRVAICCQYLPSHFKAVCAQNGIECFEILPSDAVVCAPLQE